MLRVSDEYARWLSRNKDEAAAIAVPDELVGNRIKAIVAAHASESIEAAELQQYCAQRIPKYMIPEFIEFRESLPRTSTGKLDRVGLSRDSHPLAM